MTASGDAFTPTSSDTMATTDSEMQNADNDEAVRVINKRGDLWLIVGTLFKTSDGETCTPCRFQVCSRTLPRSSPVFSSMLYGRFAEAKPPAEGDASGTWEVSLPDEDPISAHYLLQMLHGDYHGLKVTHSEDTLNTMAPRITFLCGLIFLAEKYDCLPSLRPWPCSWARYCRSIGKSHLEELCQSGAPEHIAMLAWVCYHLGDETAVLQVFRYMVEVYEFGQDEEDAPFSTICCQGRCEVRSGAAAPAARALG